MRFLGWIKQLFKPNHLIRDHQLRTIPEMDEKLDSLRVKKHDLAGRTEVIQWEAYWRQKQQAEQRETKDHEPGSSI